MSSHETPEMTPEQKASMKKFGEAITRHNEGPDLTRLREDLAFSKAKGPNYMVMTTQEAVRAALLEIEMLRDPFNRLRKIG